PRAGPGGRATREGPDALRPLPRARDGRAARAARAAGLASAARGAAALHPRALRGHLHLDGEVEDDRARRDLREHRRQPGVGVALTAGSPSSPPPSRTPTPPGRSIP